MEWIEVARTDEIPAGTMKVVKAGEKGILIVNVSGKFYALPRKCTHLGGDLSHGKLEGSEVICPLHGAHFDVTTGTCVQGPKIGPLRMKTKDQNKYELKVEGNSIKVEV